MINPGCRRSMGDLLSARTIGGIFLIISGIIGFMMVVVLTVATGMLSMVDTVGAATTMAATCALFFAVVSFAAFFGGMMAISGKRWGMAMLGGVLGLFTLGPYFLGTIFAFIGLLMVFISKHEFWERRSMMGMSTSSRPSFYGPPPIRRR